MCFTLKATRCVMQFTRCYRWDKTAWLQPNVAFWARLFRACDLLVVQPDAWDRYGGRATLCFSSFARGRAGSQGRRDAPRGTPAGLSQSSSARRRSHLIGLSTTGVGKCEATCVVHREHRNTGERFSNRTPAAPTRGAARLSNSQAQPKQACSASATTSPRPEATPPCRPGAPTSYKRE